MSYGLDVITHIKVNSSPRVVWPISKGLECRADEILMFDSLTGKFNRRVDSGLNAALKSVILGGLT